MCRRQFATCISWRRWGRPFLKEFVKPKRFPSGELRTVSAVRDRLFRVWFVICRTVVTLWDSFRLSSRREVAIVLFSCDCSQHIPSRGAAHRIGERLCLVVADADLSGANSSPYSHSIHCVVRPAERYVLLGRRIQGRASSWLVREGSRATGESLGSNNLDESLLAVPPVLRFAIVIHVGFVVLSSVGAHPWAKRMAPADDRTTKPDHLFQASSLDM